jgi:Zn-finger nucleic acid-binding protein
MKAALTRRILRVERRCDAPPRTRFIWQDEGEGEAVVEARKRAMIASGKARPTDRFITAHWRASDEGRG